MDFHYWPHDVDMIRAVIIEEIGRDFRPIVIWIIDEAK